MASDTARHGCRMGAPGERVWHLAFPWGARTYCDLPLGVIAEIGPLSGRSLCPDCDAVLAQMNSLDFG